MRTARSGSTLRRWLAVVAVLCLAASAAACGSDDEGSGQAGGEVEEAASDPGGSDDTEESPSEAEPSGPPLRVMVYTALSGVPTPFPEAVVGAEAAARSINEAGGVSGRPIEVVECDIGADPNGPVRCARQAADEGMVAVIGSLDTTGDSLGILQDAGIPSISPFPRLSELTTPVSYPVTTGGVTLVAGAITALADQGYERINVVYSDIPGTAAIVEIVGGLSAESRGVTLRTTAVPQPSADLAPIVADAARDVDAIAIVTTPTDAAKFVAAARQAGLTLPMSGHSIAFDEDTIEMLGDAAEGIFVVTNFKPSTTAGDASVDRFNAEMDAVDAGARKNDVSMGAWVGIHLFALVAESLASVDPASLIAALDEVDGLEFGLIPPVNFVRPIELVPGFVRIFNTRVMYSQVTGGVLTPISGEFVDVFSTS